jgi:hypothetical protein
MKQTKDKFVGVLDERAGKNKFPVLKLNNYYKYNWWPLSFMSDIESEVFYLYTP